VSFAEKVNDCVPGISAFATRKQEEPGQLSSATGKASRRIGRRACTQLADMRSIAASGG